MNPFLGNQKKKLNRGSIEVVAEKTENNIKANLLKTRIELLDVSKRIPVESLTENCKC